MSKPTNPYAQTYAGFLRETADHELVVLHNDGLYRHLRVQKPGTRMWSWDVTTWPGHLATSGDIASGYIFSRLPDMLDFFYSPDHLHDYYSDGAPCIDVRYWAEKLCGGRSESVKTYDRDSFLSQVREHLEEDEEIGLEADVFRQRQIALLERIREMEHRGVGEPTSPTVEARLQQHWQQKLSVGQLFSMDGLTQSEMDQLDEEFRYEADGSRSPFDLFDLESSVEIFAPADMRADKLEDARWHSETEHEAHTWLSRSIGSDTVEWDLREYDHDFVRACYAIDLTVQLYLRHNTGSCEEVTHD